MSTQTEQWRPVPGFPDYQISDAGRVVSQRGPRPRVLRTPVNAGGYPVFVPRTEDGPRSVYVHQAVAAAFIGPRPDGTEVRHLDGDPTNNNLSNLSYGSHAENMQDRVAHGRHMHANKTHCLRGHEFTTQNTYRPAVGGRVCRTCKREGIRARRTAAAFAAANVSLERAA